MEKVDSDHIGCPLCNEPFCEIREELGKGESPTVNKNEELGQNKPSLVNESLQSDDSYLQEALQQQLKACLFTLQEGR